MHLGRIKCGTESNGGFKNIAISNCIFDKCWGLALETVDGAILEDIAVSNITMRDMLSAPIFLRLGRRMRGPKDLPMGRLKRVTIDNVTCLSQSPYPMVLAGVDGHLIEDVRISNVFFDQPGGSDAAMAALLPPDNEDKYPDPTMFGPLPATGLFARHTRNVELSHVEVTVRAPDARPAVWLKDIDGFDASFVKFPSGAANFAFDGVKGFRTFGSRSVPDKTIAMIDKGGF